MLVHLWNNYIETDTIRHIGPISHNPAYLYFNFYVQYKNTSAYTEIRYTYDKNADPEKVLTYVNTCRAKLAETMGRIIDIDGEIKKSEDAK